MTRIYRQLRISIVTLPFLKAKLCAKVLFYQSDIDCRAYVCFLMMIGEADERQSYHSACIVMIDSQQNWRRSAKGGVQAPTIHSRSGEALLLLPTICCFSPLYTLLRLRHQEQIENPGTVRLLILDALHGCLLSLFPS